jgi:hypothetical protein
MQFALGEQLGLILAHVFGTQPVGWAQGGFTDLATTINGPEHRAIGNAGRRGVVSLSVSSGVFSEGPLDKHARR